MYIRYPSVYPFPNFLLHWPNLGTAGGVELLETPPPLHTRVCFIKSGLSAFAWLSTYNQWLQTQTKLVMEVVVGLTVQVWEYWRMDRQTDGCYDYMYLPATHDSGFPAVSSIWISWPFLTFLGNFPWLALTPRHEFTKRRIKIRMKRG